MAALQGRDGRIIYSPGEYNQEVPDRPAPLSTTSYAVLSLLSMRPYTTYELAKQMSRSLHWFWPRAESKLYEEPKRLVAHGLATAERGMTGRRAVTTYRITASGRRALRRWLRGSPVAAPRLECESILRVFAGDMGTPEDIIAAARAPREEVTRMREQGVAISRQALAGEAPFPHRLHIVALVHRFLWEYSGALLRWATWAESEVASWSDVEPTESRTAHALDVLAQPLGRTNAATRARRSRGVATES